MDVGKVGKGLEADEDGGGLSWVVVVGELEVAADDVMVVVAGVGRVGVEWCDLGGTVW